LNTYISSDLDGTKQLYLKCYYTNDNSKKEEMITEINFYRIKNYQGNRQMLVKPEGDVIEPVPISVHPNLPSFKIEVYNNSLAIYKIIESNGRKSKEKNNNLSWKL